MFILNGYYADETLISDHFQLRSTSAFAQTIIPQPQNNIPEIITTSIVFLIAVAAYLLTKNKIQQKRPNLPVMVHHVADAIMAAIIFYVIFLFIVYCLLFIVYCLLFIKFKCLSKQKGHSKVTFIY
ncbi:hypothetical protein CTM67_15425 [Photobacterium phosphoreum]|nr:hypothetical protein CTM67_15425 [Photobacterium phosphoreum]